MRLPARIRFLLAACGLALAATPAPPLRAQSPAAGALSRELALATFDSVWHRVRDTHYDSLMRGIDWPGARAELRPRAGAAASRAELRGVIAELLARLGESHYAILPGESIDVFEAATPVHADAGAPGDLGVDVRLVGERFLVSRVEPASPAERAGVRPGWSIERVDGRRADSLLASLGALRGDSTGAGRRARTRLARTVAALLEGAAGTPVRLELRDDADRPVARAIVRRAAPGVPVRFGNLPTLLATLDFQRLPSRHGCIGVVRFNLWMAPLTTAFDSAMHALRGCEGIVLDLRGNVGGVGAMVMGIAGYFLDDALPLGILKTRRGELRFVANPRHVNLAGEAIEPYAGALAILVDEHSASTTEFFAAGLQYVRRARLFGETTARQALPAVMSRLPNGDVLMHVVADFTLPSGARIEGRGAVPDEPVPLTRADLLAGRDAPLAAALRWIGQASPPRAASTHSP